MRHLLLADDGSQFLLFWINPISSSYRLNVLSISWNRIEYDKAARVEVDTDGGFVGGHDDGTNPIMFSICISISINLLEYTEFPNHVTTVGIEFDHLMSDQSLSFLSGKLELAN